MTCIIGVAEKGNVYIGGDSAGVAGLSILIRNDEKVFHNGPFIMGFTSSFRMGNLLRYKFDPPKQTVAKDDMRYMVTDFIDAVKKCFTENSYGKPDSGGAFMVGYNGQLYEINDDFQVGLNSNSMSCLGCGRDIAYGALFATKGKKPEERIKIALEAAVFHNAGVRPPFKIVKQLKK
jgi:ATP-dependent protease HslVU (ClpYQ) peptidase subunit